MSRHHRLSLSLSPPPLIHALKANISKFRGAIHISMLCLGTQTRPRVPSDSCTAEKKRKHDDPNLLHNPSRSSTGHMNK